MKQMLVGAALAAMAVASGAASAAPPDKIRLGFVTTLSGPTASNGREMQAGLELALKKLGNKIGGIPVEVFIEDTKMGMDTAQQSVSKQVEGNNVHFLVGHIFSHHLLAYYKSAADRGVMVLSGNAGPSRLAGEGCDPNVFVYSWENSGPSEAVGQVMTNSGVKKAFFLSQNYVAGKEHVEGARKLFKGDVAGEAYVPVPQVDYSAEITSIRASGADSVYFFLPGAGGIAFLKQFANSGLTGKVKLFAGIWQADELIFPATGDTALDVGVASPWLAQLDNPANRAFVSAYRAAHNRNPVLFTAYTYDSIIALDQAVTAVKGEIGNKDALRAAMRAAKYDSIRGSFAFANNHFPIQDYYAAKVVKKDGTLQHEITGKVLSGHKDNFSAQCAMK